MKKIFFLMAAVAVAGAFTSCRTDTQPRLEEPTEFVLNTPPTANQIAVLTESGEGSTMEFTCSQPNYGIGVVTHYEVQVSETENFAKYESLLTVNTQAQIEVSGFDMSCAVNGLRDIREEEDEDKFYQDGNDAARKVYVRVRAYIPNVDPSNKEDNSGYSSIFSNVVSVWVKPYFAVPVPGMLYLIGKITGWSIETPSPLLVVDESENGIKSNIFSGTFEFTEEQCTGGFRFYSALGNWDENSIGSQKDDNAIGIDFESGDYEGECVVGGKGSWSLKNFAGGKIKITVDLNTNTVYFKAVD